MSIFKLAAGTVRLFHTHFVRVDFATLHAVENRFGSLRLIKIFIPKIIVSPQPQNHPYPQEQVDQKAIGECDWDHCKHKRARRSGALW